MKFWPLKRMSHIFLLFLILFQNCPTQLQRVITPLKYNFFFSKSLNIHNPINIFHSIYFPVPPPPHLTSSTFLVHILLASFPSYIRFLRPTSWKCFGTLYPSSPFVTTGYFSLYLPMASPFNSRIGNVSSQIISTYHYVHPFSYIHLNPSFRRKRHVQYVVFSSFQAHHVPLMCLTSSTCSFLYLVSASSYATF